MTKQTDFDAMFHPKSVAVVGASRKNPDSQGWLGMFGQIKQFGYTGRLYPINPKAEEIEGLKAYPDLVSLPEPAELVVVTVPAPAVPAALRDCVASGSRNVHIFSSGFKETGEEPGLSLQKEIEEIAVEGRLRVVGPNCMGLYVPKSRIVTWRDASPKSGPVAFISQSGGHAGDFTHYASQLGIYFSKVISFGNALTLDSTDFLDYLADDPDTEIIAMYLEGVKDGRKLLSQVREINKSKPVVILKGGLTESGARAAASHTGSMAGGESIWKALYEQTGAIRADSLEDMAEVIQALLHLKPATGRRVAVLGTGGGVSVAAADACARAGLDLLPFEGRLLKDLRALIPPAGNMIRNPIDAEIVFADEEALDRVFGLINAEKNVDLIVVALHLDWFMEFGGGQHLTKLASALGEKIRSGSIHKPLVVAWRSYQRSIEAQQTIKAFEDKLVEVEVPVFKGLPAAAGALSRWSDYYRFRER
ncbi:MAG: CoA-binding protein [Proteobacteria bacterium]|nr:CoA-binding protein [Pseudomonadota bacterium]